MPTLASFPHLRMRRLRKAPFLRQLVQETHLQPSNLIYPVFITEGSQKQVPILAMPGVHQYSLDTLLKEAAEWVALKLPAIALFPAIASHHKSSDARAAYDPKGLVQQAIRALKADFPSLGIVVDVALDPFTDHGHDGIMNSQGEVLNDPTLEVLTQQALSLAEAGADILAPSDMMDGRIGRIRQALEAHHYPNVCLLAYSAKYASHFYAPFREAIGSASSLKKRQKCTYQMNPANTNEALREVALDLEEGADIVMIKPALPYLDVIWRVKQMFQVPTFAYQVSGEYSMLKAAMKAGWLEESAFLESLISIKRAGADAIITYFAKEMAKQLLEC